MKWKFFSHVLDTFVHISQFYFIYYITRNNSNQVMINYELATQLSIANINNNQTDGVQAVHTRFDWLEVIEVEVLFPVSSVTCMQLIKSFLSDGGHLTDHPCHGWLSTVVHHSYRGVLFQKMSSSLTSICQQANKRVWKYTHTICMYLLSSVTHTHRGALTLVYAQDNKFATSSVRMFSMSNF